MDSKTTADFIIKNNQNPRNILCISGGGTRGIYAIGLLKYLFDNNNNIDLDRVNIFGGTSVGSYFATALSLGFNKDDMMGLSRVIDLSGFIDNSYLYIPTAYRFLTRGYLYEDSARQNVIMAILNYKFDIIKRDLGLDIKSDELNVGHLKLLINKLPNIYKHLIINTVDISRGKQIFMTTLNDNFDDVSLLTVMMASSAIPYIFKPVTIYNLPGTDKYFPIGSETTTLPTSGRLYESYAQSTTLSTSGRLYESYAQSTTINYFVDGGVSTNNPLDYFLLNADKFLDYNVWLVNFTQDPRFVKIDGTVSMLKQLIEYLVGEKNDIKMTMIHREYNINMVNLKLQCGPLEFYNQAEIQKIITDIYTACVLGEISFNNNNKKSISM